MTYIGINGFGRIGKIIFIQLLKENDICVKAINIPDFDINNFISYLKHDSSHKYIINNEIKIIDNTKIKVGNNIINILNSRDPKELNWSKYGIEYVIDATGVFLTLEKAKLHNIDYLIMCAPPKDDTPTFTFNGNHTKYKGEKIISNASCTTNALVPVLKLLDDEYNIISSNFTTIHASTASQTTIDTNHLKNRTHRSIYNNIIPHSTGASKSVEKILPNLKGKIKGTSLRVPVMNVSIVDLNITLKKPTNLKDIITYLKNSNIILVNENEHLVSSDFTTTTCPSIIDKHASMDLGENQFKLLIWYDNEWSYSSKVIDLLTYIISYNKNINDKLAHPLFIENVNYEDKNVVLRVDWNIPFTENKINDDFRIISSIKTINYLLSKNPNRLIIISHLGRPKGKDLKYSWNNFISQLNKYFEYELEFLDKGLSEETLSFLKSSSSKLFLLENIRFYDEETNFNNNSNSKIFDIYNKLGDVYVNDAFGTCHREHMSVVGFKNKEKSFGYLINKEINALQIITNNKTNNKILAIMGGAKMDDKLPLLDSLSHKVDGIYIAGGNINSIRQNEEYNKYINSIQNNKAKIYLMEDGIGSKNLDIYPSYDTIYSNNKDILFFDIGQRSIITLSKLVNEYDIIFWNGPLGVIENELYSNGSKVLFDLLNKSKKKIIIGGGDTAGFINQFDHSFHYVSTGGGAALEYISNNSLIGIDIFGKIN